LRNCETEARQATLKALKSLVQTKWPAASPRVFGSFSEDGGHIYASDVDVELIGISELKSIDDNLLRIVSAREAKIRHAEAAGAMATGRDAAADAILQEMHASAASEPFLEAGCGFPDGEFELHVVESHPSANLELTPSRVQDTRQEDKAKVLNKLGQLLRKARWCDNVKVLSKARVPIASFFHRETGVMVDVTVGLQKATGDLARLPWNGPLSPLVCVLKVFFAQQDLDKVCYGGLGSYRLYLLVAAFIETIPETNDLGRCLVGFLEWAGNPLNLNKKSVLCVKGYETNFESIRVWQISEALRQAACTLKAAVSLGGTCSVLAVIIDSDSLFRVRQRALDLARNFTLVRVHRILYSYQFDFECASSRVYSCLRMVVSSRGRFKLRHQPEKEEKGKAEFVLLFLRRPKS
jgi:hypothetical protein